MKKRIVCFAIWILVTAAYVWNLSDTGRSMGAFANKAIESYSEMMVEYGGTSTGLDNLGSALGDMSIYNMNYDLSKKFKGDFISIGVTTALEIVISIACYHFATKEKEKKRED